MKEKTAIVVGAGAWGGWSAYMLRKAGWEVTLIDMAGPGHNLAGSGGETRVIRMAYGGNELYTDMVDRAFQLFDQYEKQWDERFYHETGSLWMFRGIAPDYATLSAPLMKSRGYSLEEMDLKEVARQYSQVDFTEISSVFSEAKVGYLEARRSCGVVKQQFELLGGTYIEGRVAQVHGQGIIESIELTDGQKLRADHFVFACGPWTSRLFPGLDQYIHVSRQEVYYFEMAEALAKEQLPVWIEFREGDEMYYGIPDHEKRTFKIAYDQRHWSLNPDQDDRGVTEEILAHMRAIMTNRFPAMADAALIRHHTCVYESSPDGDFIIDMAPDSDNALVLCGSSGHGFKMGPAVGEMTAAVLNKTASLHPQFGLERFKGEVIAKTQYQV